MKKHISSFGILTLLALGTLTTSCSNDDDGNNDLDSSKGSNYKVTITLDDVNKDDDFVSISFGGGTNTGKVDVWKLNGIVKTGESIISLNKDDFTGVVKTYVIETTEPIQAITGSVQIINYGENLPVKLKIEKEKEEKVNENLTLSGDGSNFNKQYTF